MIISVLNNKNIYNSSVFFFYVSLFQTVQEMLSPRLQRNPPLLQRAQRWRRVPRWLNLCLDRKDGASTAPAFPLELILYRLFLMPVRLHYRKQQRAAKMWKEGQGLQRVRAMKKIQNRMSKKQERKQNIARGCQRAILTFFKHWQAKTRGDLLGNALMNFTHLFDKMLFFLWAFYPIMTIVSYVYIQLWFDIVWYYVILVMCLWKSPQFLERVTVKEYEKMFANIQASCSIIFSLQNNNNYNNTHIWVN